ncbi:MAG: TasA family protein [Tissierellales bacterium]
MNKRFIAAILAVTLICAMAGAGTMAWFTSQAKSSENTFNTGTLILGGIIDGEDVNETFATVAFNDMEPGEPPYKVQTTQLKNVGSLPFYLYRITASTLVDGNIYNDIDDTMLNNVLMVNITIGDKIVYDGRLSQLVAENGGYFDPIYEVNPDDSKDMVINAYMDPEAGNEYQGLSMKCDLTVYARQNEYPVPGEGGEEDLGEAPNFSVVAYNTDTHVNFDWDWKPNDLIYEYYKLEIKHHTGEPTTEIEADRLWFFINFTNKTVYSLDGIEQEDITVDWGADIVKIEKSAFPDEWEGFEVKISGMQDLRVLRTLTWQYWSLDR